MQKPEKSIVALNEQNIKLRTGLRKHSSCSIDIHAIRLALMDGENSGEPRPLDITAFKQRMQPTHG